ncbi:MAG TPA: reverse transcriptase domain-containing protein [Kofleriaceae bacterium]|nr:reverse transcriptase domain-containing protein [Kofleriaceae bacterium]
MLTLVELVSELKALVVEPDGTKLDAIAALFEDPRAPAEYQVARHFVAKHLRANVQALANDPDPKRRRAAIAMVATMFPRSAAIGVLRPLMLDVDAKVRYAASRAIGALHARDVSPLDVRYNPNPAPRSTDRAAWAFGIFTSKFESARAAPRPAARVDWIARNGLPAIASAAALRELLHIADEEAMMALMRPGAGAGSAYIEFEIAKAKGGAKRTIAAPRPELRRVQRAILDAILAKVPLHDACHGFVPGRSTVSNARPHLAAALVVKLDLKDFFPTVSYRRVLGLFTHLGYGYQVAAALAGLTTYRPKIGTAVGWPGVLPQGAPTSPALANIVCRRLDRRLDRLATKFGATYTRYADDLTFSFATRPEIAVGRFLWWVDGICHQEGFVERPDKRRVLRSKHQQRITGIVVNAKDPHVPRVDKRAFRALLHNCRTKGIASQARDHEDFEAYLRGYAAYAHGRAGARREVRRAGRRAVRGRRVAMAHAPASDRKAALLQAVLADPDNLDARRVYADELAAHDDPRGEYIQVEVALLGRLSIRRRAILEARSAELFAKYGSEWFPHRAARRGGFVSGIEGSFDTVASIIAKLEGVEPTSNVTIHLGPSELELLATAPWTRGIRRLALRGKIRDGGFATLCAIPGLAALEALNVTSCGIETALGALAPAAFPKLTSLTLTANPVRASFGALANWSTTANLERLFAADCGLVDADIADLLAARPAKLVKLGLSRNKLTRGIATVIAGHAPSLQALTHLEIAGLERADIEPVLEALPRVRVKLS